MRRTRTRRQFNWRMLLVRIVINALTLLIVSILPNIYFVEPTVLSVLFLSVILGVLNALVKPILQFLTLRFIFITYGFAIVIINTIILLILNLLFPDMIAVDRLVWAIIGGALMGFVSSFLESLFGLQVPILPEDAAPQTELIADPTKAFERKFVREAVGTEEELAAELPLPTIQREIDEQPVTEAVEQDATDADDQQVSSDMASDVATTDAVKPDVGLPAEDQTIEDANTETTAPVDDDVAETSADTEAPQQGEEK